MTKSGLYFISTADPDAGSIVLISHGSGMEKNQDTRSGINLSDHISESLVTRFWLKILKFFVNTVLRILDPVSFRPWIRDPGRKNSYLESGIDIPVFHYHMSN